MYDATQPYKDRTNCVVYTLTDKEHHPLYIGAYLHGRKFGFLERYQGQTGTIDAAMSGTGKSVFVANVDKRLARDIEGFLMRKELDAGARLTNRKVPRTTKDFKLHHTGEPRTSGILLLVLRNETQAFRMLVGGQQLVSYAP